MNSIPSLQQTLPLRATPFFRQLKLLLFAPDRFFAELPVTPVDLKTPSLIVFGLFLIETAGKYDTITAYAGTLEIADPSAYPIVYVGLFALILSPFFVWIYYAAVFYGISYLFGGRGAYLQTLAFVGYGCVPLIVGGLLHLTLFRLVSLPVRDYFIHAVAASLIDAGITIPVLLWCGLLWTAGMRHARNLPVRRARVTVFVPVGLAVGVQVVWLLWKLTGAAGQYAGW